MIDLTALEMTGGTSPALLDWGGELTPPLGGISQRIDRLGSRHTLDVVAPPRAIEPDGRVWISRLKRAKREGGIIAFPQVEFDTGNPGAPRVASAVPAGKVVPLKGLTAGYPLVEGQWLTIIHNGRRFLYSIDAATIASAGGSATITVTPMLRSQLSADDIVLLAQPQMEGWLSGDELRWTLEAARMVGLQFTITERA